MTTARKHFLEHYQKAAKKQTLYELRKGYGLRALTILRRHKGVGKPLTMVDELHQLLKRLEKEELALTVARKNAGLPVSGQ